MGKKFIDLTGQSFGKWTVLFRMHSKESTSAVWKCRCSCGSTLNIYGSALRAQKTLSCRACRMNIIRKEICNEDKPEYKSWDGLKQRCSNPNNASFNRYGELGVTVCERWKHSFDNFLADMGPKPSAQHSIDRKDNNGNYEPGNCRWATKKEQARNRTNNKCITFENKTLTISEWAEITNIAPTNITRRLKSGWTIEKTLTHPERKRI